MLRSLEQDGKIKSFKFATERNSINYFRKIRITYRDLIQCVYLAVPVDVFEFYITGHDLVILM